MGGGSSAGRGAGGSGGAAGGASLGGFGGGTAGAGGARPGGSGGGGSGNLPPLHVEGTKLLDPDGNTVVLRGIDFIDLAQVYAYNNYNFGAVKARIDKILAVGFTPRVVRIPVYPRVSHNGDFPYASPYPFPSGAGGEQNGPSADEYLAEVLEPSVDYFTEKGLYVIIDFHQIDDTDGDSAAEATEFWQYMAPQFADRPNVLYEPYNEPMDPSTPWSTFKPRAQAWVDTIRSAAPDNIIIVPSMAWCQHPGDAANSPLTGENLMYTMHIYPSNWNPTTREQLATATAKVPVFITEWGYMLNSTDPVGGTSDPMWFSSFRTTVDGNGASWSAWVTDDGWAPPMFADSALNTLTDFGTNAKQWLADASAQ
jgi:aryl-phospho-beta-D-glucosidase BglC (GH1 family)